MSEDDGTLTSMLFSVLDFCRRWSWFCKICWKNRKGIINHNSTTKQDFLPSQVCWHNRARPINQVLIRKRNRYFSNQLKHLLKDIPFHSHNKQNLLMFYVSEWSKRYHFLVQGINSYVFFVPQYYEYLWQEIHCPIWKWKKTSNMTMPLNRKTELQAPNSDQVPSFKTDQ